MFVQRVMVDVAVPSGQCSDTRPLNIDNYFVVVDPYYAFTYVKKVEFSARLHYLWNSINNHPFAGFGIKSSGASPWPEATLAVSIAHSQSLLKALSLLPP